ncbi:MAG TPA: hypothetical protein GXX38_09595 [Clostridia bacterium]|jgi:hypothetical protein|nr:hypothetical protein [Clostridia bacterium]
MKIYLDADSCPFKSQVCVLAAKYNLPVVMVMSIAHWSKRGYEAEIVYVDNQFQAADIYLMNNLEKGDVLITQDYGLAAVALSRDCLVLSPRGKEYTRENIDSLLMERHIKSKLRRGGGRHRGQAAYTEEGKRNFIDNLCCLIKKSMTKFSSP